MTEATTLTAGDFEMALFFLKEGGDITRWCYWSAKREALIAAIPEIDDWFRAQRVADTLRRDVIAQLDRAYDGAC